MGERVADAVSTAAERTATRRASWLTPVAGGALAWVGAVLLVQVLVALAPGDAVDTLPDPALRAQLALDWGLGRPVWERILTGTVHGITGAWGSSWTVQPGSDVAGMVGAAVVKSAPVVLGAWTLAVVVGLVARGRTALQAATAASALPVLLLTLGLTQGINAAVWYGMQRGWWPRPSFFALPTEPGWVRDAVVIAALGIGSGALGEVAARLSAADAALSEAGFVLAARARSGSDPAHTSSAVRQLLWRHRVVPLLEASHAVFSPLVGGLVIVERLCARPGAGDLLWRAVAVRDVPVATGVVVALAGCTAAISVAVELARRAWDPRLRRPA